MAPDSTAPTLESRRQDRLCEYCSKSFSKKEHYLRHVRTHTKERPFICSVCASSFVRRDTLLRHTRSRHDGNGSEPSPASHNEQADASLHGTPVTSINQQMIVDETSSLSMLNIPTDEAWSWDVDLELDGNFAVQNPGFANADWVASYMPWNNHQTTATNGSFALPKPQSSNEERPTTSSTTTAGIPSGSTDISSAHTDEISRATLANSLSHGALDTTLPSTDFLNRCIHNYATKLWAVLPVIHLPTFRPSETNPLLLLSICSVGSLLDRSPDSQEYGNKLFKAVNRAILASWDPSRVEDPDALAILQAATIGQTFALASSDEAHQITAQAFHGTVSLLTQAYRERILQNLSDRDDWDSWIRIQTVTRLINLLQVHDGEVVSTFHRNSVLQPSNLQTLQAEDDALFLAKTAQDWRALQSDNHCLAQRIDRISFISAWAVLGTILACGTDLSFERLQEMLLDWFSDTRSLMTRNSQGISSGILCNSCWINILCDLGLLDFVRAWITTDSALRSVIHAQRLLRLAEQFRITDVPGFFVPRACFHAGIVLAVFSLLGEDIIVDTSSWPEITLMNMHLGMLVDAQVPIETACSPKRCRILASAMSTVLHTLRSWNYSASFADSLDDILKYVDTRPLG